MAPSSQRRPEGLFVQLHGGTRHKEHCMVHGGCKSQADKHWWGVCVCVYHVRRVGCKDLSPIACLMICTTFRLDLPCHAFGLAVGCKQGSKCKQWSLVPKATWWMVVASYFSEWLSGGGRVKVWGFIEPLGRVIAQWQLQPGGVGKTGLTL